MLSVFHFIVVIVLVGKSKISLCTNVLHCFSHLLALNILNMIARLCKLQQQPHTHTHSCCLNYRLFCCCISETAGVFQPSNIFFAMDGSVKIGDFGLVTAIEENCCDDYDVQSPLLQDRRHTDQVGTKLYMSPEQVRSHSFILSLITVTSVQQ